MRTNNLTPLRKTCKKGQGLSINTVVISVIVVIVLIIIVAVFSSGTLKFGGDLKKSEPCGVPPNEAKECISPQGKDCSKTADKTKKCYERKVGNYVDNSDPPKRIGECCVLRDP